MISIIIPVYNGERTLLRCVSSVLAQTEGDYELIVVDDGSKDATSRICDDFVDARVKVLHKENGGVSSARNMGLDNAQGEFVTFIDADDFVSPFYLENLKKGSGCDLSTTGFSYAATPPPRKREKH